MYSYHDSNEFCVLYSPLYCTFHNGLVTPPFSGDSHCRFRSELLFCSRSLDFCDHSTSLL